MKGCLKTAKRMLVSKTIGHVPINMRMNENFNDDGKLLEL